MHSQDWHNFRASGIGSSDCGVLMGFTQWKTIEQLWLEKTGQAKKKFEASNPNIDRGVRLEPAIRADIELKFDMDFPALEGVRNKDFSFLIANLDGWNEESKIILECKAPNEKAHREALEGRVPDYYYPQVQHQLLVMECNQLIYASMFNNKVAYVEVETEIDYQSELLRREAEFWGFVSRKERPPEDW